MNRPHEVEVFSDIASAEKFMSESGRGFYIPLYQRSFSWGEEDIGRFFENAVEGIKQIVSTPKKSKKAVSFIGTIVCMSKKSWFEPEYEGSTPTQVYALIDGQQRITALMAIAVMIHDYLRVRVDYTAPESDLRNSVKSAVKKIENMIELRFPSWEYKYCPRIISHDDRWTKTQARTKYKSPVSNFIFNYGKFYRENGNKGEFFPVSPNMVDTFDIQKKDVRARQDFYDKLNFIKHKINHICMEHQGSESIILDETAAKKALATFLGIRNVKSIPREESGKENEIVRALALHQYFMKRFFFATLVTANEELGFDIFESLNTTGMLLTPYETFRPMAISAEGGLGKYEKSKVRRHIENINPYLDGFGEKKEKRTSEILVSFALAECGKRLSKENYKQRKFMKDEYERCERFGHAKRHEFVQHLQHVAETYQYLWDGKLENIPGQRALELQDETMSGELRQASFCLKFLGAANHTIQISLIARFYDAFRLADPGHSKERARSLCQAIKAVSAFFAIWRTSREHTDGIEDRYRKIMLGSLSEDCFKKFQRRGSDGIPDIHELKKALCYVLREDGGNSKVKISSETEWVTKSKDIPIYRTAKAVAKFIILLASHRARPDENFPGLLIGNVREGVLTSLIDRGIWGNESYRTIEHIIPQSKFEKSVQGAHPEHAHRIGNLTLLPKSVNAMINDWGWGDGKRAIYRMLASETEDDFNKNSKQVLSAKIISEASVEKLRKGRCLPMTAAVAQCKDFDSLAHIDARGENLLELAWRTLSKWLDFDSFKID